MEKKRFIHRVTITGADDSTNIDHMVGISKNYPWVEWGILLSKSSEGRNRFPSEAWMRRLQLAKADNPGMNLSGHLCGSWVRDLCVGNWTFAGDRPGLIDMFGRIQLNFHAFAHKVDILKLSRALWACPHIPAILQLDDVNNDILGELLKTGVQAYGLFDLSGGAGTLPAVWPYSQGYYGYAGGLSADNVAAQIEIIATRTSSNIWIDAETRLRPADDSCLDMDKVNAYIEASMPWVTK